jgi:hypothetical protein
MQEMDIKLICANSKEVKGRVERKNRDLIDQLVKALRIAGIKEMETANTFLTAFLVKFNDRFSKAPDVPKSAYKLILSTHRNNRPKRVLNWCRPLEEFKKLSSALET